MTTDCIKKNFPATEGERKSVTGRIHSFESCGTVDGPVDPLYRLLPWLPDALPLLP